MIYPGAYEPRPRRTLCCPRFCFLHLYALGAEIFRPTDLRNPLDYEEVTLTAKDGVRVRAYVICQPEPEEEPVNSENKGKQREVGPSAEQSKTHQIHDEDEGYVSYNKEELEGAAEGSMEDLGLDVCHSCFMFALNRIIISRYSPFLSSTHVVAQAGHRGAPRGDHQMQLLYQRQFNQVQTLRYRKRTHPPLSKRIEPRITPRSVHLLRPLRKLRLQQRLPLHNSRRITTKRARANPPLLRRRLCTL